jgi:predicted ribosome quality control (RQC) complex YloA/Tae2 family protein
MEADIDYTKSAQENAQRYFERSKDAKRKLEGAERAIERLEGEVRSLEKSKAVERKIRPIAEREWYEKFYWFFASDGTLAVGGRSAQQNEEIVSKHLGPDDLFMHANIFGASAVALKNGKAASKGIREEAAQFAACFSKAWESGQSAVDVFAVGREQLSKSSRSGSLGTGSFLMSGEREWFKNVRLELCALLVEIKEPKPKAKFAVVPSLTYSAMPGAKGIRLAPGKTKKSEAAARLAKLLHYDDIDYIMQHLPPGGFHLG